MASACGPTSGGDRLGGGVGRRLAAPRVDVDAEAVAGRAGEGKIVLPAPKNSGASMSKMNVFRRNANVFLSKTWKLKIRSKEGEAWGGFFYTVKYWSLPLC